MADRDTYSFRIDKYIYSRTNEKEIVAHLLKKILQNKKYNRILDIGPGPGILTEILAPRSQSLTLIEVDPSYESVLKKKFPSARLIMGSFLDSYLDQRSGQFYDVILCSQVLYYIPEDKWVEVCEKLVKSLSPGGQLLLIMNTDAGDWWKIIQAFKSSLGQYCRFHYKPWSAFTKELKTMGQVKTFPYSFQIRFDSIEEAAEGLGAQFLQIYSQDVLDQNMEKFKNFISQQLNPLGSDIIFSFNAEMLVLSKP